VLTKGADHVSQAAPAPAPAPAAPPVQETPAPVSAPAPQPAAPAKKPGDALSAFDALIENAPEDDEEEIQAVPVAAPKAETPAPAPKAEEPVQEDAFYKDPLIQAALVKFEAEFVKN